MLEYNPYYFRGQELYSFKLHLISIEKKQKKTIHKKHKEIYKDFFYMFLSITDQQWIQRAQVMGISTASHVHS